MQKKNSIWKEIGRLIFLFVIVNIIGFIASLYMTPETLDWYHGLPNSSLTPPDWVFGVVWTTLFLMMSVSAWWVWGRASPRWFCLQLMANMAWSFTFFYLKLPLLALFVLISMIFFICKTIQDFYKFSKISAYLLIPLLLWCLFALYLNFVIVV